MKHSYSLTSQFYLSSWPFEAKAVEAWAEAETAEFEVNTSSLKPLKHCYSFTSQFYLSSWPFEAAEAEAVEAAEAWAEVETAEFEVNTSSMKPLNEALLQFYLTVLSFLWAF